MSIAIQTVVVDVLASGEFCNARRRIAHLLGMYGFVLYVIATVVMVFDASAGCDLGAALVARRPDDLRRRLLVLVLHPRRRRRRGQLAVPRHASADLFILSLLASATLGLIWAWMQAAGAAGAIAVFGLYILATTVLFGGVYWSKFAHMFFKPAAAFEKRVSEANGTNQNLPTLSRDDPAQRERHSMELLRDAPMDMGLGIKREPPRHY